MVSESSNGIEGLSMIRWNFVKAYPIFHCNKMVFLVLPYPVDTYLATILLFTHQIILPFLSRKEFPLQPNPCLLGTTLADLNKTSFFFSWGPAYLVFGRTFPFQCQSLWFMTGQLFEGFMPTKYWFSHPTRSRFLSECNTPSYSISFSRKFICHFQKSLIFSLVHVSIETKRDGALGAPD